MVAESINAASTIAALVTVVAFDDNFHITSVIRGSIVFVKQVRHVHQLSQQNSLSSQLNSEAKQMTLNQTGTTQIQNKRGESRDPNLHTAPPPKYYSTRLLIPPAAHATRTTYL